MPANINRARLLAAVILMTLAGCGKPEAYCEVEGKVTLDGQPLPGVHVWFYPEGEGGVQPPYATGVTDAQGVYTLTAVNGQHGALVGKNRVAVNRPPGGRSDSQDEPPSPGPPIPVAYTQAADTPILVEVKAGPRQTIDLPLQK
jgi:hypothetical protein